MVRLEFQDNTKMLTVPTNNIFDQKYCIIITTCYDYTVFLIKNNLET